MKSLPSLTCPHCGAALTDEEMRTMLGKWAASRRKVCRGGRPRKSAAEKPAPPKKS